MLNARRVASRVIARILYRKLSILGIDGETGIRVLDGTGGHQDAAETFRGVQEAIALLRGRSEVHGRWLSRCANQLVLIAPMRSPAAFERKTRSVLLSCDVGVRHDSAAIATFLAHESAHARIAALGVGRSNRDSVLRRRIEHRCVREQLDAIGRIDPDHYLVQWSGELLHSSNESRLSPSTEQLMVVAQRTYRRIREEGYPRWIGRLAARVSIGVRGKK